MSVEFNNSPVEKHIIFTKDTQRIYLLVSFFNYAIYSTYVSIFSVTQNESIIEKTALYHIGFGLSFSFPHIHMYEYLQIYTKGS